MNNMRERTINVRQWAYIHALYATKEEDVETINKLLPFLNKKQKAIIARILLKISK